MRLLIATDGSDLAVEAAKQALSLLTEPGEITVVTAIGAPAGEDEVSGFAGPTEPPEEQERILTEHEIEATAHIDATLMALGVDHAERRIVAGEAGPAICAVAKDVLADVVVVGSHGRGLLGRAVLGSVSDYVTRHAPCPVLVVRADADGGA